MAKRPLTSTAGGSGIDSNDIVGATEYPDPTTGAASGSEREAVTVNALGQVVTSTDRNGTTHTYTYDVLGRRTVDAVTTLGSGVDGSVRRVVTEYGGQGQPYRITSYSAVSGGAIVNQVLRDFNGLGQLITEWQSRGGAVSYSTTPKVQYAYSFNASGTANHSRLTSVTYPDGYQLIFSYTGGSNNAISRLSAIGDSTGTLEAYLYLGLGTVVERGHPTSTLVQTYVSQTGSTGDAGGRYTGLDRFGRVVEQLWYTLAPGVPSTGVTVFDVQYGYDANGNVLWRNDRVNSSFSDLYSYDTLNQLATFARGTLNGTKTGISGTPGRTQSWDYDALGNWNGVTTDGSTETRSSNAQNEYTSIGGATTPTYDASGNMTTDETGKQFVHDAWNRLVAVKNASGTTLETFSYDSLNRRVTNTVGGTTTDLYYSDGWQVLEERVGTKYTTRYVWSPVYVDAMVSRDTDTSGTGLTATGASYQRLWPTEDANWNVTALVDTTGTVVERYAYDPFGVVTVYDASYAIRGGGSNYGWAHLYQGGYYDGMSGLYFFRNRNYSGSLGRWASLDPVRFNAGDENLYRTEINNPIRFVDPNGLESYNLDINKCTLTRTFYVKFVFDSSISMARQQAFQANYLSWVQDVFNDGRPKYVLTPEKPFTASIMGTSQRECECPCKRVTPILKIVIDNSSVKLGRDYKIFVRNGKGRAYTGYSLWSGVNSDLYIDEKNIMKIAMHELGHGLGLQHPGQDLPYGSRPNPGTDPDYYAGF